MSGPAKWVGGSERKSRNTHPWLRPSWGVHATPVSAAFDHERPPSIAGCLKGYSRTLGHTSGCALTADITRKVVHRSV